jgi:hypothetical protein
VRRWNSSGGDSRNRRQAGFFIAGQGSRAGRRRWKCSGIGIAVRALSLDTSVDQWDWATIATQSAVNQNVFGTSGVGLVAFQLHNDAGGHISQAELDAMEVGVTFCLEGSVAYQPSVPLMPLDDITLTVLHCAVIERIQ